MENTEDKNMSIVELFTSMDVEKSIDLLDFLCSDVKLNPLDAAKVKLQRGKSANQRVGDLHENIIRFNAWKKQFEKEWKKAKAFDSSIGDLDHYALNILFERMERQKGNTLSR